jgi:hypothetical protein
LTAPLDAALVDDARVFHGVTAVTPEDPSLSAHRDVLVVTLRSKAENVLTEALFEIRCTCRGAAVIPPSSAYRAAARRAMPCQGTPVVPAD